MNGHGVWSKYGRGMVAALAIVIAAVIVKDATGQAKAGESLQDRAELLVVLAEQVLEGEITYALAYETKVALQDGQSAEGVEQQLRAVAGEETASDIIVTSMPKAAHLFIRLYGADAGQLLSKALEMERVLASSGWLDSEWQIRADGKAHAQTTEAMEAGNLQQAAEGLGNSRTIDQYRDEQSIITRYFAEGLGRGVVSGGDAGNLQIALHRHSESGQWTAALATPMLTGEF
ncbi:hypothetical protein DUZ99_00885 [Xylanibacillus composti]|nr:hypothetical protein [Xylanibacillus composti]